MCRSIKLWKTGACCNGCAFRAASIVWPDENHWILKGENSRYLYQEVHAWLKKYLDEPGATTSGLR